MAIHVGINSMKLAYLTFLLSFGTLASTTIPSHQGKPDSIIRSLSSNSNSDISSSSFDACNIHFKDYVFPDITDNEYYKKKLPISEWS